MQMLYQDCLKQIAYCGSVVPKIYFYDGVSCFVSCLNLVIILHGYLAVLYKIPNFVQVSHSIVFFYLQRYYTTKFSVIFWLLYKIQAICFNNQYFLQLKYLLAKLAMLYISIDDTKMLAL
jgi:hypothetical protein